MQQTNRCLRVLHPQEVESRWPTIRELLEPAIPFCNGEFEVDDLRQLVADRHAFVVGLEHDSSLLLAAVCEVLVMPRKKVMNVLVLGGTNLASVAREFWDRVADIGHTLGADSVRGAVRPSMQRLYRRIAPDATVAYTILERKL